MELKELIELLDTTETYDKENLLIDIYIFLIEKNVQLNIGAKIFVELTRLRDTSLSNGSESYFEEFDESIVSVKEISEYMSEDIKKIFNVLHKENKYQEIDEWIIENEWKYNDELAKLIKTVITDN